jgi:hypothetical protein
LGREDVGSGERVSPPPGEGIWRESEPLPEMFVFLLHKNGALGAYFAQFYVIGVEDLLLVRFRFYSGMLYNFTPPSPRMDTPFTSVEINRNIYDFMQ